MKSVSSPAPPSSEEEEERDRERYREEREVFLTIGIDKVGMHNALSEEGERTGGEEEEERSF